MKTPANFDFRKWFEALLPELMGISTKVVKTGEDHIPMLMVFDYFGASQIYAFADFGDVETKNFVAGLQKKLASNVAHVAGVIFICEVWTINREATGMEYDEFRKTWPGGIQDHPDRIEKLMFNAIHGGEQLIATCAIDRDKQELGKPDIMDPTAKGMRLAGRMVVGPDHHH